VNTPVGARKLRILVVDDSMFMRATIAKTLTAAGFEVIGQAKDGKEAVERVIQLQPDVVTMDFNMPTMNGAEAVRAIFLQRPTPVVMFSAHTRQGARETFDALAAGAVDFVTKPAGEVSMDLSSIRDELVRKIMLAASARPRATTPAAPRRATTMSSSSGGWAATTGGALPRLCVIAVSTGGPAALSRVIPALPADTRFGVVVVQHMPRHFTGALAERLDADSAVTVQEASDGDRPQPGLVLIAPGDRHLEFDERGSVVLSDGPLVHGCRPAADITMQSAARVWGRRCIGVVMTGMGKDGAAGALAIKRADGKTLAQDQETSVIFGMPRAAIELGAIDEVAPLDELAARLRYM
jgi:two-component system, chemotaxis family, protein-glutamate methylesterase/glutaminase